MKEREGTYRKRQKLGRGSKVGSLIESLHSFSVSSFLRRLSLPLFCRVSFFFALLIVVLLFGGLFLYSFWEIFVPIAEDLVVERHYSPLLFCFVGWAMKKFSWIGLV
jgi:hypothetical protein